MVVGGILIALTGVSEALLIPVLLTNALTMVWALVMGILITRRAW